MKTKPNHKRNDAIFIIVLLILFFCVAKMQAQLKFGQTKATVLSVLVDPGASIKESGLNIGLEISHTENKTYMHTGVQSFSKLQGNYIDWITSGGLSLTAGTFENTRLYVGPRIGLIKREKYIYPTWGLETGIDHVFKNKIVIGLRATEDYRGDFAYYGAPDKLRFSGFVKVGFQFN